MRPIAYMLMVGLVAVPALHANGPYAAPQYLAPVGTSAPSVSAFGSGGLGQQARPGATPHLQPHQVSSQQPPGYLPQTVAPQHTAGPTVTILPARPAPVVSTPMHAPVVSAPVYSSACGSTGCGPAACSTTACRPQRFFTGSRLLGLFGSGCSTCSQPAHQIRPVTTPTVVTASSCGTACSSGCGTCKQSGAFLGRLKSWFQYRDTGDCPKSCGCHEKGCGTPLYQYFFRECAAGKGCCAGSSNGAVNPPYSQSVFPRGHLMGSQPAGINGGCCGMAR